MTILRRLALTAVLLAALPSVQASHADTQDWPQTGRYSVSSPAINVSVISDQYGSIPVYRHQGQNWVPGLSGDRYQLRIHNPAPRRVLVVISVDGVNVVTGQTASVRQSGYVLNPGQTAYVDGWRKNRSQTARFYFSEPADSYASRTDRPDDLGVIGFAVFDELAPINPWNDSRAVPLGLPPASASAEATTKSAASPSVAGNAADASPERLGTGHGERSYAPVSTTTFQRASDRPSSVLSIRYQTPGQLRRLGVWPRQRFDDPQPNAFPDSSFVPDPYR